jgi:hypothetical protein
VTINGDDVWLFHVNVAPGETVEDFGEQRCVDTIRGAAGVDDLDVEIISIKSWIMGAELSTAFRDLASSRAMNPFQPCRRLRQPERAASARLPAP